MVTTHYVILSEAAQSAAKSKTAPAGACKRATAEGGS